MAAQTAGDQGRGYDNERDAVPVRRRRVHFLKSSISAMTGLGDARGIAERSLWRRMKGSSVRAFAVKPRAFGAPRCGFGA